MLANSSDSRNVVMVGLWRGGTLAMWYCSYGLDSSGEGGLSLPVGGTWPSCCSGPFWLTFFVVDMNRCTQNGVFPN